MGLPVSNSSGCRMVWQKLPSPPLRKTFRTGRDPSGIIELTRGGGSLSDVTIRSQDSPLPVTNAYQRWENTIGRPHPSRSFLFKPHFSCDGCGSISGLVGRDTAITVASLPWRGNDAGPA